MTRTMLLLTVSTFCFVQDPTETTLRQSSADAIVQTGPADSKDQRVVKELQEFRNQLLAVYGENHPIIKQVDRQILVNTAKSSLIVERLLDVPFIQLELSTEAGTDSGDPNGFGRFDSRRVWLSNEFPHVVAGTANLPGVPAVSQWVPYGNQMLGSARGVIRKASGDIFDGRINQLQSRWEQATDAPQKEAISEELRNTIEQRFDEDLEQRRQQFVEIEKKLAELKQQIEKRESMRDEFVQILSRHTELTWDGISLPSPRRTTFIAKPETSTPPAAPAADNTPSR